MSTPIADSAIQAHAALAAAGGAGVGAVVTWDSSVYWLGVPLPVVLAAVAGAALALSLVGPMTRRSAFAAWLLGAGVGTYTPPLLDWWLNVPSGVWPAAAFLLGLLAHMALTAFFQRAPGAMGDAIAALIDRIKPR